MKNAFRALVLMGLWLLTWTLSVYLESDVAPPRPKPSAEEWSQALKNSTWFDRKDFGINHIFLRGTSFELGLAMGRLPGDRLERQERSLFALYKKLMPYALMRKAFEVAVIRFFSGVEHTIETPMLAEMWGVSQSGVHDFDSLASPYARQVAYHGIHEVGQMFVDFAPLSMACTFVGLQVGGKWVVGRTFDFEGGSIFDEEKVLKWVEPESGYRYVSVIWTGMVGAVSAVNEKGLYVSLNAAGSRDFNRLGLPSTLLLSKILQTAANADEALAILKSTPLMITDIFLVLDSSTGRLYRVEKSAAQIDIQELHGPSAVTNHLEAAVFKNDSFNRIRRERLTSTFRLERARALIKELDQKNETSTTAAAGALLGILRDKGRDAEGHPLHLGNRRAIDALIAAHGIVFDSSQQILYVSQGPAMSGALRGYDLKRSFDARRPVEVAGLPADSEVPAGFIASYREKLKTLEEAEHLLKKHDCRQARARLAQLATFEHSDKELALFHLAQCEGDTTGARKAAERALKLGPPYKNSDELLRKALQ